jgi:glycosyltransferase involved in cell wall biosynthesis
MKGGKKDVVILLAKPYSIATRMRSEAETLADAGHKVTVLAWDRWGKEPKSVMTNGVNVISLRLTGGSDLFVSKRGSRLSKINYALSALMLQVYSLFWCLQNVKGDFILHLNFNTLPVGATMKIVKPKSVRLVYDCHELTPALYSEWYGSGVGQLTSSIEKAFLPYVDLAVTVTPPIRDYLLQAMQDANRPTKPPIVMLYNTVKSQDLPTSDKTRLRKRFGLSGFVVTFVGSMRGEYALEELLQVASLFKRAAVPARFIIVGGGSEFGGLERRIVEYGISDRVKLIPQLPHKQSLEYLKAGDLSFAVFKSLDDNARIALPWKVFEAMACGTPVIVLKNSMAWSFVSENGTGFAATTSNVSEIYDKILWAVNHPEVLAEMSRNAGDAYSRTYNWESVSRQFTDAYSSL